MGWESGKGKYDGITSIDLQQKQNCDRRSGSQGAERHQRCSSSGVNHIKGDTKQGTEEKSSRLCSFLYLCREKSLAAALRAGREFGQRRRQPSNQGNEILETRKRPIPVCSQWGQEKDPITFLASGIVPHLGTREVQEQSTCTRMKWSTDPEVVCRA